MICIAIVADHTMVRAGLRQFFADRAEFEFVAEAGSGREALAIVRRGGVDVMAAIHARKPALPGLILSGIAEEHDATTLLRQGAADSLSKYCDPEEIVKAIRTVARSRKYITAGIAESLASGVGSNTNGHPVHEQLSERELTVFLRPARGETICHMAIGLSLSVKTVSTYRTRVMEKMQLASNSDLTYCALKNGFIHRSRRRRSQAATARAPSD